MVYEVKQTTEPSRLPDIANIRPKHTHIYSLIYPPDEYEPDWVPGGVLPRTTFILQPVQPYWETCLSHQRMGETVRANPWTSGLFYNPLRT